MKMRGYAWIRFYKTTNSFISLKDFGKMGKYSFAFAAVKFLFYFRDFFMGSMCVRLLFTS